MVVLMTGWEVSNMPRTCLGAQLEPGVKVVRRWCGGGASRVLIFSVCFVRDNLRQSGGAAPRALWGSPRGEARGAPNGGYVHYIHAVKGIFMPAEKRPVSSGNLKKILKNRFFFSWFEKVS